MTRARYAALVLLACVVAGCAMQPEHPPADPPAFLLGLLHGFIALFSLVASLFWDVRIYAYPNGGIWYDFGFVVGAAMFFGGGVGGVRR